MWWLFGMTCIIIVSIVSAWLGQRAIGRSAAQATQPQTQALAASWAESYDSVASLKRAADLVVLGTIGDVISVERPANEPGLVYTNFALNVQQVLASRTAIALPTQVILHQTGAREGNVTMEVHDDPLFQTGDHVVLFLREYEPGHYFVLGGPQGRFHEKNGTVSAAKDSPLAAVEPPTSLAQFVDKVKKSK
jgi:hypothetical protein